MSSYNRVRKFLSNTEKHLQECRDRWGREHKTYRDRTEIAQLFQLTKSQTNGSSVDNETWSDLEMNTLFDRLDSTITPIGRQYLYRQLRHFCEPEAQLKQQYKTAQQFLTDKPVREQTQLILMGLSSSNASAVTGMLFGDLPDGYFPKRVAWLLASLPAVAIFIALLFPALLWLPILPVMMNFAFSEHYSDRIGRHSLSFGYLKKMLLTATRLEEAKANEKTNIPQFEYLRNMQDEIKHLHVQFRVSGIDSTSTNVIVAQLAFYLNLFCLFDFLIFMRSTKRLIKHKPALINIYNAVASVDSAISVASYLSANSDHCNPVFSEPNDILFDSVVHPLLDNAVANDFSSLNSSALITGSNMAGKSTFIKTIGINLILAQTLWLCHANAARVPRIPVLSSIKHADSLAEGKSYYFAEIEALLHLINASKTSQSHVFLIDEILHGTNTVERVASSAAILSYLAQNNTVLVTSHDVELTELLPKQFESLHFRETIDIEAMFDYKIYAGPCTTRNAISLLESIGFPSEVISAARRNAGKL